MTTTMFFTTQRPTKVAKFVGVSTLNATLLY